MGEIMKLELMSCFQVLERCRAGHGENEHAPPLPETGPPLDDVLLGRNDLSSDLLDNEMDTNYTTKIDEVEAEVGFAVK